MVCSYLLCKETPSASESHRRNGGTKRGTMRLSGRSIDLVPHVDVALKDRIKVAATRVRQLWSALECDVSDVVRFLSALEGRMAVNNDLVDIYEREVVILSEQIPIVEQVTKREFLKFKLLCLVVSSLSCLLTC